MSSTPQHSPFAESTLKTEFEIRPPSPPPEPPAMNLTLLLLPGIFMGVSAVAMFLVALTNAAAPAQLLMNFAMVGFMLMSVLTSWLNYHFQQQQYERTATKRRERYLGYLKHCENELKGLLSAHVGQRLAQFPTPGECHQIVMNREAALWQRDTRHADFLVLRCGLGTLPAPVEVKLQEPDPNQPQDELFSEAEQVKERAQSVSGVPLVLPVSTLNIVGLIGAPPHVQSMAAGLIAQIAALHRPGSVYIAGALPFNNAQDWHWRWLRWLPHVWTPGRTHCLLASTARDVYALAERIDDLCRAFTTPSAPEQEAGLQPHVVILVDLDEVPRANEILRRLVASWPNVHLIVMASASDSLPRECNWIVECGSAGAIRRVQPTAETNLSPDPPLQPNFMESFAETLMRFWEQESEEGGAESSGETVTLFQLWESQSQRICSVQDIDVARAWQRNQPFKRNSQTLAVPIGRDEDGALVYLNLHDRDDPSGQPGHGPHGLVAGATGSGKSELLQSLIASLAAHFSPRVLSFLLVDYKGGGTADVFRDMPHVAGIITNLADESLSQRALLALQSEIQRRQERFQTIGVNYIDDYQSRCAQDRNLPPMPRLVIIVDEFAELAQNQPEFIRQLVRTARVGRSLGVHLILATQKPSGVVNEQIWSNSRFRICLRVESPSDSNEMLKRPDAARLTRSGQAYLQVGSGELFLRFQAAYANAPYVEGGADLPEPVFEIELDGRRRQLSMPDAVRSKAPEQTQLVALVSHICDTAQRLKLGKVDSIWIPPLPDPREEPLALLDKARDQQLVEPLFYPADSGWDESKQNWRRAQRWLSPLVGLMDDPRERRQERLYIPLGDPPAHLLVYGMPSSGKTTFLLTLALGLIMDHTPEEVHLYALDFGARALNVLSAFPHTADVIVRGEAEKVVRLFKWLQSEAERRRQCFNKVGVSNLRAYLELRQHDPSHPALPAVVVLVDGYPAFVEAHPEQETQLEQLMRECAGQGIHFVIVGGSATSIKSRISSSAALAVTFQQIDPGDYVSIVGRAAIRPAALPGRGLVRRSPPLEFQTALPVRTESEFEQTELLRALGERMRAAWRGDKPSPIRTLPEVLPLCELLEQEGKKPGEGEPPIALATDTLSPLSVPMTDGLHFLISGPAQGGKTTLLLSWLVAMSVWHPPKALRLFMCDLGDFPEEGLGMIRQLPHCESFEQNMAGLEKMLTKLNEEISRRRGQSATYGSEEAQLTKLNEEISQEEISQRRLSKEQLQNAPTIILALDNLSKLAKTTPPQWLAEQMGKLVQQSKGCKFHILASIGEDALGRMYNQEWLEALKGRRSGFLVGTSQSGAMSLRLPPGEAQRSTPTGFGYFIAPNLPTAIRVKFANPFVGSRALPQWVDVIVQHYENSRKPAQ